MGGHPFGVLVDAEIFGLSPYGGLIRYWEHLLRGLDEHGIAVELLRPKGARAPVPTVAGAQSTAADRWIFHPTYLSSSPRPVDATALTVHDTIYEDFEGAARTLDPSQDALQQKRRRIASADLIIVPSQSTRDGLDRHYPGCRAAVRVIPVGVDPRFIAPVELCAQDAAGKLRAQADCSRPYLLHVGGREHYKNFGFLLNAYLRTALHRRFDLVAVGSQPGPLPAEDELLRGAPAEARVAFLGQVAPDLLAALYRDAAALVSPSLAEGFGLAPVEAGAGGTPVAHSAIAILEETLGPGGHAFDPTDRLDFERAIYAAVTSGIRGRLMLRARLRERFRWDRAVRKTIAAYRARLAEIS